MAKSTGHVHSPSLMPGVFLELILNATDLSTAGIEGRDEIDDPLTEALIEGGLGEVSGGGGGSGVVLLDIEIADEVKLDDALAVIRPCIARNRRTR